MLGLSRDLVESVERDSAAGEHASGLDGIGDGCARVADSEALEHASDHRVLADVGLAGLDADVVELDRQTQLERQPRSGVSADSGTDPSAHDFSVSDGRRVRSADL